MNELKSAVTPEERAMAKTRPADIPPEVWRKTLAYQSAAAGEAISDLGAVLFAAMPGPVRRIWRWVVG